ncbi:MAG: hypothetical protein KDD67_06675 [Ignavibacteriae bacterium]|nr:hypothetical protein [Ignavibacteriota bacterium]MCB9215621.1 hypothetical protein [Ignavibacteria bacterium]
MSVLHRRESIALTAPEGSIPNWPWRKPQAALHGYVLSDASALKGRLCWKP